MKVSEKERKRKKKKGSEMDLKYTLTFYGRIFKARLTS